MFILAALFSLMVSCEKTSTSETVTLNGNWGLVQTELYKNGTLNGSIPTSEITTYYRFENYEANNSQSRLVITEDGNETIYSYTYSSSTNQLTIGESNSYHVEELNENLLVFHKEYEPYKSIYTFKKVE